MQANHLPTEEQLGDTTTEQLDAWAAILVMGWEFRQVKSRHSHSYYWEPILSDEGNAMFNLPSFSLDAEYAQRLMHKLATEWLEVPLLYYFEIALFGVKGGGWAVSICDKHGRMLGASSDWLPTAICLTCIRYRLAEGSFSEAQLASLALWNEKQAQEER